MIRVDDRAECRTARCDHDQRTPDQAVEGDRPDEKLHQRRDVDGDAERGSCGSATSRHDIFIGGNDERLDDHLGPVFGNVP